MRVSMKLCLLLSTAELLAGCGTSKPHEGGPVDPSLPEVQASRACQELESYSDLLQAKQGACTSSLPDPIPPFKDSHICWSSPAGWGQRCLGEKAAREVYRECVNALPLCFPDGTYEFDWEASAVECVHKWREALNSPSCDVWQYVP